MKKATAVQKTKKNKVIKVIISVVLIAGIVVVAGFIFYDKMMKKSYPEKYSEYVSKYSDEYDVDEVLLYAIIRTESGFNPKAESSVGALGLTQIMPDTFDWLMRKTGESYEDDALFTPEISIKYCALFISILQDSFSDRNAVIAAYHAGAGTVKKWLADTQYSSDGTTLEHMPSGDTSHYVYKVTKAIEIYNNLYDE